MVRSDVISASELHQGDRRLDAAYYSSVGGDVRRLLGQLPVPIERIADVASRIFIGGRSRRIYVQDPAYGVPFLSSSDMLLAEFANVQYVSRRAQPALGDLLLDCGWTLISRSGTIGNVAYASDDFAGVAASEHVMRVVPSDRVAAGYLFAWLASDSGVGLIKQGTFGSVIPTIEPDYVGSLPIPRLGNSVEHAIHDLVERAAAERVEANRLLRLARDRVYEVTGLLRYEHAPVGRNLTGMRSFTVTRSTLVSRLEARFHDVLVREMQDAARRAPGCESLTLAQCTVDLFMPNRGRWLNVDEGGVPFVSSGDMFCARIRASRSVSRRLSPGVDGLIVDSNDILVARSGQIYSILGDAVLVRRGLVGKAVTEDAIRVRPDSTVVHPGFLYAFLTLPDYGYGQIVRTAYGTSIPHLSVEDLRSMLISVPNERAQQHVGEPAVRAIDLRDEANDLEDEAQLLLARALGQATGVGRADLN